MSEEDTKLIAAFETELRAKVNMRTGSSTMPEKTLLEAFKYYDLSNMAAADRKTFFNVVQLRLSVSIFSEEQLERIWRHYAGTGVVRYREFVTRLFNTPAPSAQREDPSARIEEVELSPAEIRRMTDLIIFKLRQQEMASFLKLFREFVLSAGEAEISLTHFSLSLRKSGGELTSEDINRLYHSLAGEGKQLNYHRFFDLLLASHTVERVELLQRVFARLDFAGTNRLNVAILKELFNARNHPAYRSGRQNLQEVTAQFEEFIDVFARLPGRSFVVDGDEFVQLFSFLSAHTKDDKDFTAMLEHGFRYNELPRLSTGDAASTRSDLDSLHPENRLESVLAQVNQNLRRRGPRAHIHLFKALKCNDFDNDGYIYFKEFCRGAKEARLELSEQQLQVVFDGFSDTSQRMRYALLLERLVPALDAAREESTRKLYERLFAVEREAELSFHTVTTAFNPKGHPDFRSIRRADYDIREEFEDALQTFLVLFKGSHLSMTLYEFTRFFEFLGWNWDAEYLAAVQTSAFRTRGDSISSSQVEIPEPVVKRTTAPPKPKKAPDVVPQPAAVALPPAMNYPFYTDLAPPPERPLSAAPAAQPRTLGARGQQALCSHQRAQEYRREANPEIAQATRAQLLSNIVNSRNIAKMLEIEFELTNKADKDGFVDLPALCAILDSTGVSAGLTAEGLQHLFLAGCGEVTRLNVQNFANDLRGKMTEGQEAAAVGIFKELVHGSATKALAVDRLRSALNTKKAATKVFRGLSSGELKENWDYLVDLFVCLNVASRKKSDLDLEDFLYFLDNFIVVPEQLDGLIDPTVCCFK